MWRTIVPCLIASLVIAAPAVVVDTVFAQDISIGYATNGGTTSYKDQVEFLVNLDLDYATTHALYIAADMPFDLGKLGTFRLGGSITLPATEKVETSLPDPPGLHDRDWSGDTIWGTVDGLLIYSIVPGFSAAAGFRWDHWQTSLSNPYNVRPSGLFADTDTADVTINMYLPLLGVLSQWRGFSFGVLGFPTAWGDVELHERLGGVDSLLSQNGAFDGGYFVEVLAELSPTTDRVSLGGYDMEFSLFAKYSALRATGSATWQVTGLVNTIPTYTPNSFQRNMFVPGGKAAVDFSIPSWAYIF